MRVDDVARRVVPQDTRTDLVMRGFAGACAGGASFAIGNAIDYSAERDAATPDGDETSKRGRGVRRPEADPGEGLCRAYRARGLPIYAFGLSFDSATRQFVEGKVEKVQ